MLEKKEDCDSKFDSLDEAIKRVIDIASAAKERSSQISGVATYIQTLDEKIGGLQPSDLIILAGRPGMGKTSLATNIAFNIANAYNHNSNAEEHNSNTEENEGGIVGFFSLEMSSEQLATRIISEQTEVSSSDIRRGRISEEQFSKIIRTMKQLKRAPLYIDQTGGISVSQLVARARHLKKKHGLDILIIDYIQLMTSDLKYTSEYRMQEITVKLKALAKELNIPIIALSQLSHQVENRTDKRPKLLDLGGSGSIEQDADIVLFIYREEYYLRNEEPKIGSLEHAKWQDEMDKIMGKADVIVAKQRHGPTGTVQLAFQADFTRFSDLADSNYLPEQIG